MFTANSTTPVLISNHPVELLKSNPVRFLEMGFAFLVYISSIFKVLAFANPPTSTRVNAPLSLTLVVYLTGLPFWIVFACPQIAPFFLFLHLVRTLTPLLASVLSGYTTELFRIGGIALARCGIYLTAIISTPFKVLGNYLFFVCIRPFALTFSAAFKSLFLSKYQTDTLPPLFCTIQVVVFAVFPSLFRIFVGHLLDTLPRTSALPAIVPAGLRALFAGDCAQGRGGVGGKRELTRAIGKEELLRIEWKFNHSVLTYFYRPPYIATRSKIEQTFTEHVTDYMIRLCRHFISFLYVLDYKPDVGLLSRVNGGYFGS
jgi:hypothetical protein